MTATVRYKKIVVELVNGNQFVVVDVQREPLATQEWFPWVVGQTRSINPATLQRLWTKISKDMNFINLYSILCE